MPKNPKQSIKYKSGLESDVHKILGTDWKYEEETYPYLIPRKYTPDFTNPKNKDTWIEVKGFFKDYNEVKKYIAIKSDYPHKRIIFIFSNPNKKCYAQVKKKKDGTVLTMAQWADKYGFEWYSAKEFLDGKVKI